MPKLGNRAPSYRLHRSSGQAIVGIEGKTFYLGPWGSTASREEYDRIVGRWLANGRCLPREGTGLAPLTIAELVERYRPYAEETYPTNISGIAATCRYLVRHCGKRPVTAFDSLDLKAIIVKMIGDGLSRTYVNDHIARTKRLFSWAVGMRLASPETLAVLREIKGERKGKSKARESAPVLPVDPAIVERTLPHLSPVVADMVRLHRRTGMRPTELCTIRPGDIDRGGECWWYVPQKHKTQHLGRQRRIPLGPRCQAILAPYLDRDPAAYCFVPAESEAQRRAIAHAERTTPLSCGNRPGSKRRVRRKHKLRECYTEDSYRRAVAYACAAAFGMPAELRKIPKRLTDKERAKLAAAGRKVPVDITDEERERRMAAAADWRRVHVWHPNQLRHLVATELRRKYKTEGASVVLGHAKLNTTEIYAEKDYEFAAQIAMADG